jgi:hypothetical protein
MSKSPSNPTASIVVTNAFNRKKQTLVIGTYEAVEKKLSDIFQGASNDSVHASMAFDKFLEDQSNCSDETIRDAASYMNTFVRRLINSEFLSDDERADIEPLLDYKNTDIESLFEAYEKLRTRIECQDKRISVISRKDTAPHYREPLYTYETPEDVADLEIEAQARILARAAELS